MNMKKAVPVLVSTLMLSSAVLSGCAKNNAGSGTPSPAASASTKPALAPVDLVWYTWGWKPDGEKDLALIEEEVNKITKAKINATVKLKSILFSEYDQKMNTIIASAEPFDLVWASNWRFNYLANVTKGAFLPLDDLLKHAPNLTKAVPAAILDGARVNGKLYGLPNYQTLINMEGFRIQKRFLDKYKFDTASIKKFEDIEPLLASIKAGEKDVYGLGLPKDGLFKFLKSYHNMESIASVAAIKKDDASKVFNMYETEEYKQYLKTIREWNQKGYLPPDPALGKSTNELGKTGQIAMDMHNVLKAGTETYKIGENQTIPVALTKPYVNNGAMLSSVTAISKSSKNPERAMMLVDLVNSDKQLYNLLCFGIEGKHYTKVNETTVKEIKDSGYGPGIDWVFGNQFNAYIREGTSADIWDRQKKENETATVSKITGFQFNQEPVQAEFANIKAVLDEYEPGLATGSVDVDKYYPEFISKLKKAGAEKYIAEVQKQLDEWKKNVKK